jgi:hypothetical protein
VVDRLGGVVAVALQGARPGGLAVLLADQVGGELRLDGADESRVGGSTAAPPEGSSGGEGGDSGDSKSRH